MLKRHSNYGFQNYFLIKQFNKRPTQFVFIPHVLSLAVLTPHHQKIIAIKMKMNKFVPIFQNNMFCSNQPSPHKVRCVWFVSINLNGNIYTGADPGIAPSEGRRENFWGISCEK
jgi:hypothetical protein